MQEGWHFGTDFNFYASKKSYGLCFHHICVYGWDRLPVIRCLHGKNLWAQVLAMVLVISSTAIYYTFYSDPIA